MTTRPRPRPMRLVAVIAVGLVVRAPVALAQPAPAPPAPRRSIGLMAAGIAALGGSYAFTALVGLQMRSGGAGAEPGYYCPGCDGVGSRLLIPIVGPWLALPAAEGTDGKVLTAVMGTAQVAGLVLTVAGTSRFIASGKAEGDEPRSALAFGVAPLREGAFATAWGRF